jgi:hypothetical protein
VNQSNALYSLQRAQLIVLKLILQDVQNLSQLYFIVVHIHVFLLVSVDVNDTKSCEIVNLCRYDEALFQFMILLDKEEYRNDNNTTGDVLDVFNNTLLAKEDRNMKTYDFISQESSKIIEKENDIFLKNVREEFNPPLFLNGLDTFPFLDGYINKINERKKELEELEKKYEKNPVGLAELQKLYSEIFANMANLYSTEIFQEILRMHNKLVKMKKECKMQEK